MWVNIPSNMEHLGHVFGAHDYKNGSAVEERASGQRIIISFTDSQLQREKFKEAIAMVTNNDARYQINKDRARQYNEASGSALRWAAAVDLVSSETLQAENCDK